MSACNTAFFRGNRHHVLLGFYRYLVSGSRCRRSVTASFPPPLAGPAHSTQTGGQCTELVWGVVGFKQSLNCATSTTVLSPSCPLPRPLALFLTPSLSFSSALSLSLTFLPSLSPPWAVPLVETVGGLDVCELSCGSTIPGSPSRVGRSQRC